MEIKITNSWVHSIAFKIPKLNIFHILHHPNFLLLFY